MEYTVSIERMAYSADAVAHLPEGKVVFVPGAAPGDTVRIEVVEDKGSFARARLVELVEASSVRTGASAPHDEPSTCPWQHIAYDSQLEYKRANVVAQLAHTVQMDRERAEELVGACVRSKREWGYRNKLELACGTDAAGRFEVGVTQEGSDELIPIDSSLLVYVPVQKAPKALRGALRFAQGASDLGIFRIGVRTSLATGETEVALWTRPGAFPRGHVAKTLAGAVKATSIVRVLADPGRARKVKGLEVLDGRGFWRERMGDCTFSMAAPSFFQVNTAQAQKLVDEAKRAIGDVDGARVADLYAGGGTFSIPLAKAGAQVVAVEAASSSVKDLRHNAQANKVDIDVVGGDAARELAALGTLDALVVDPPRAGLAKNVPADIARAHPGRVVYVSCNPSTWVRDVVRFAECGYRLVSVQPVDMFPQTYHVEIVSAFERA